MMLTAFQIINATSNESDTQIWVSVISAIALVLVAVIGTAGTIYSRRTNKRITSLDKSVNGVPEGTLPLVRRVFDIEQHQEQMDRRLDSSDRWITQALLVIGEQLGADMPDRRDY